MIEGSNEMGLHLDEMKALSESELAAKTEEVKKRFLDAGAHFVIKNMSELPALVETVNKLLAEGKTPSSI